MENILKGSILTAFLIILGISYVSAQDQAFAKKESTKKVVKTSFTVNGVCQMCEKRIETAALIKGVKMAEWDKNKQSLEVYFKSNKTDEMAIQKAVAAAGHDTEKVKATDEAYQELPDCCKYRDGVEVH